MSSCLLNLKRGTIPIVAKTKNIDPKKNKNPCVCVFEVEPAGLNKFLSFKTKPPELRGVRVVVKNSDGRGTSAVKIFFQTLRQINHGVGFVTIKKFFGICCDVYNRLNAHVLGRINLRDKFAAVFGVVQVDDYDGRVFGEIAREQNAQEHADNHCDGQANFFIRHALAAEQKFYFVFE